jgi:hypothetical protein
MAIRVKFDIDLQLSESSQGQKELGKSPPWSGINDQQDNGGTWRQRIDAGDTDILVDLNGLANGRLIAIKTDQEISVKKNSAGGEAWTIRPLGTGALDGIFMITTDGITSLYLTNAGSLDAEVTFSIAGVES